MLTRDACWIVRGIVFKTYVCVLPSQLPNLLLHIPPIHTYKVWIGKWEWDPRHQYFLEHSSKPTLLSTTALGQPFICPVAKLRIKAVMWLAQRHMQWKSLHSKPCLPMLSWVAFCHTFLHLSKLRGDCQDGAIYFKPCFASCQPERKMIRNVLSEMCLTWVKLPEPQFSIRSVSTWMHDPHKFYSSVWRVGCDPHE